MKTVSILSLGCKVNFYESEFFSQELEKMGFRVLPFGSETDVCIINSCTVTAESDRKVLQMVRRAASMNPKPFIIVTGCLAQIGVQKLRTVHGINAIVGNRNKTHVLDICRNLYEGIIPSEPVTDSPEFGQNPEFEHMFINGTKRARAVIKIEDGCNSKCAYCIISSARGPARSKPADDVIREAALLAASGYSEIILTGIELSSYSGSIPELVRRVSEIPGIRRVRLGSLDPFMLKKDWTDELSRAGLMAPHFHISLQSGCTKTLSAMRRKYTAETAKERILYLKERFPDAMFFADVIVGFPGETEEDFTETVNFIKEIGFLHLHIFPYSRRKDTLADTLPDQIPTAEKRRRCAYLDKVQKEIKRGFLEEIINKAEPVEVLFETDSCGTAYGHSLNFVEISAQTETPMRGKYACVLPLSTDGNSISGKIIM